MSRIRLTSAAAVLFALFLALPAASAADVETVHRGLQQRCDACHLGEVKVAELAETVPQHCNRCHAPQAVQGRLVKVADTAAAAAAPAPALSPTVGMRYPLYYDQSLRGDAPNEMVAIPAGKFIMGTDERLSDEGPQHTVHLDRYSIDKYEVTNLQYKKFIDATGRRSPKHFRNRTYPAGKADHPVTYVTWYDAKDYCEWAGKRLPTDAEWEKAARGTDGRTYPWGNDFGIERANTPQRWAKLGQSGDTTPVGAFEKGVSPYGLYDMSGNVWEWTSSWYLAYPGNKTASENYGEHYKTLKGGSWFDCSFYKCGISAPVYNRSFFALKVNNDTFGFRCAKDTGKK